MYRNNPIPTRNSSFLYLLGMLLYRLTADDGEVV